MTSDSSSVGGVPAAREGASEARFRGDTDGAGELDRRAHADDAVASSAAPAESVPEGTSGLVRFASPEQLRARRTAKWTLYPPDVLPMPVAETDVLPAEPVRNALVRAVQAGGLGYPPMDGGYQGAFAEFAAARWGWAPDPADMLAAPDAGAAVTELLRALAPVGPVIVSPPVYDGFFQWPTAAGVQRVDVPLIREPVPPAPTHRTAAASTDRNDAAPVQPTSGPADFEAPPRLTGESLPTERYRLDLDGIDAAFAAGASLYLLCHPHNPTGTVHARDELAALADIAYRHGGAIISDEVHAPLVFDDSSFVPFLSVSETAAQVGAAVHSPSKAWNLAGLKCALAVVAGEPWRRRIAGLIEPGRWSVGVLGALAAETAYREGGPWLDEFRGLLQRRHQQLHRTVREQLPGARVAETGFGFTAWLDLEPRGWPGEAAEVALRHGRLALGVGSAFGAGYEHHVRVNLGTSEQLLAEGLTRLVAADRKLSSSRPFPD